MWAIMSLFSVLDRWDYKQNQILTGFCICLEWISLGAITQLFCCNSTFHLISFCKMLQRMLHCLVELGFESIILQYIQRYCFLAWFCFFQFHNSPFFLLHILFFDSIFLLISVITDYVKKLNPSEAPSFFQYFVKQDLS